MFVYNTTIKVDNNIIIEWLEWQKNIHIPEILSTGLFFDHRVFQLLEQDDTDGKIYVVQYLAKNKNDYDRYMREFAPAHCNKAKEKWGEQIVTFRSLLQAG